MATDTLEATDTSRWSRIGSVLLHEFREVIPPTLFFFVGFNLVLFTKRLFLQQYLIEYAGFLIATTGALIVGKVVLVADKMPFLRRFDYAPLAYPILFKTVVYTALVGAARLIEALIHFLTRRRRSGRWPFRRARAWRVQLVAVHCDADVDIRPVPRLGHGERSQQPDR